jgi:hypothetical protein
MNEAYGDIIHGTQMLPQTAVYVVASEIQDMVILRISRVKICWWVLIEHMG